jgi:2-oxoglutarate ferredoxin oxidoreductase subunit alpha
MTNDLVIGMAGSGGDGIVSAGDAIVTAAALDGYHAMLTKSFGPQIRGGESSCRVRLSTQPVRSSGGTLDVAVALNWDDFLKFGGELPVGGRTTVVYDSATNVSPDRLPLAGVTPREAIAVPIGDVARRTAGTERAKNSVVLGLLAEWVGVGRESLLAGLRKKFAKKGAEVLQGNEAAFAAGLEWAAEHPLAERRALAPATVNAAGKMVVDGNEMCAAAAIFAGCEFFGGYPITPSSEIMHFLGRELWKHGGVMMQCEDEIAGIGAVVGASFAGKKAMTATSGPGMSLKTEMLGLASIAELPLVCVNVQRGGPSTGIPTKSEQSDLFQACFSAHGDVVRPVLAPVSVADTFAMTVEAFNVAEHFQTPVILLSDQEIAQRKETVDPIDTSGFRVERRRVPHGDELERYERFKMTESGISPISHPGLAGGNYLASGIEHNERGAPTASGEMHARMNDKRIRKLEPLKWRRDLFLQEGDPNAPLGLVAWGSVAGAALEAVELARAEGIRAKLLVPKLLFPVAEEVYGDFFRNVRAGLVIEQSHQGHLYRILRMYVNVPAGVTAVAKSGSNPILPSSIVERLRKIVLGLQRQRVPEVEPAG